MTLKKRLQEDWKQALKSRDKFKANTISMAKASVLLVEKTEGRKLDDNEIIEVLAKEVKQRRESLNEFKKGNRQDLIKQTQSEIEILLGYLPQQLTEEEITEFVIQAINQVGSNSIKHIGEVMAIVVPKLKSRADGKLVSQIIKQNLNN